MAAATFQDRIVEFFTLREAGRQLASVPGEVRSAIFRELRLAAQRREAAETLWPRGSTAEALRLAAAALDAMTSALDTFPDEARPSWLPHAQELVAHASSRLADAKLPVLESDTEAGHEELFRVLVDSLLEIEGLAGPSLADPRALRQIGVARAGWATTGIVSGIALLVYLLHTPVIAAATASGQRADGVPEKAFDGDISTGWFLPDHVSTGWIDFELGKARSVRAIHILASNPPYNDRDIKDVHIDALLKDVIVKSVDVTFPEPVGKEPSWNDVVLDVPKCDHLHFTIKGNYGMGLGIAELELK